MLPTAGTMKTLQDLERFLGGDFPEDYKRFLARHPNPTDSDELRAGDKTFYLYRATGQGPNECLFATTEVEGHESDAWQVLRGYAALLREDGLDRVAVVDAPRRDPGRGVEWLESRVCIGDGNGDPIFFDQDDWSLWVFYYDGCEVERLADSFSDLEVVEN
jgi:hypothetical protein